MPYDLSKLESLPSRGKISIVHALIAEKPRGNIAWTDWDLANQMKNKRSNTKAKNAKAKHRKKFSR